jgi:hypothetical protein
MNTASKLSPPTTRQIAALAHLVNRNQLADTGTIYNALARRGLVERITSLNPDSTYSEPEVMVSYIPTDAGRRYVANTI